MSDHDPGDEDRRPDGPWCDRCGDAFDGPERDCPTPAPGRPYVDCGRGGHMFRLEERLTCLHPATTRGENVPRVYGSWRTEACTACGAFRTHGHDVARSNMSAWQPASEYAEAVEDLETS